MDRFYLILMGIISTIGIIGIAICLIMAVIDDREYSIYDDYEYDGNDRVQEDKMDGFGLLLIALGIVAVIVAIRSLTK